MNALISEIDTLRKKLEHLISGNKNEFISENTIMECSQELDNLITIYYKQTYNAPLHTKSNRNDQY